MSDGGLGPLAGPPALPPGTFRIDRDGVWRHEGLEVTHPGVLRNLYANLGIEGGAHYLQIGPARIPVDIDDTPFVVTRLEARAPGAGEGLSIYLTDGTVEALEAESLWIGPRETPYCRVKGGRFTARLSVASWLQLARYVEEDPGSGVICLAIGGRRLPVARR